MAEDQITPICDIERRGRWPATAGRAALCLLAASAGAGDGIAARAPVTTEYVRMDAYARARLAESDRALLDAASAYREALSLDPTSILVAQRSYRQAMLAGDKALALRSAHVLDAAAMLPRDGTVLLLIDAIDRRKYNEARAFADRIEREENLSFVAAFARSWLSVVDGPYDPPVIAVAKPQAAFALRYQGEQVLLQRLAMNDASGARNAYVQMKVAQTPFGVEERWMIAERFAALGQRDIATELLRGSDVPEERIGQSLAQAHKLYRKNRFTPLYGLAALLNRLAIDLAEQDEHSAPMTIARMASFADPSSEDIRIGVARSALAAGYFDTAHSEAGMILPASPLWLEAQSVRLRALVALDRDDEAVMRARQIAEKEGGSLTTLRLLGDVLMQTGHYAEAAKAYGDARQRASATPDVSLLLQLGGALERSGQWAQAKPLLEKVAELAPDSPIALNYLGYALADRGEELPRAITLLEKANRLRPNDAALSDSLGWAYFRADQYHKALPLLQSAAEADPSNGEISEHLGDLLWATGSRFEARYSWEAALVGLGDGQDEAAARARIRNKLDGKDMQAATP